MCEFNAPKTRLLELPSVLFCAAVYCAAARQVAACQGHMGALLPSHIRAAYQVLSEDGKVPHKVPSKPLKLR